MNKDYFNRGMSCTIYNHINFLNCTPHRTDLINYLHDLNSQLKNGHILLHRHSSGTYLTNLCSISCNNSIDSYKCIPSEFAYKKFGDILTEEAPRIGYNNISFKDGEIFIDPDPGDEARTVLLHYNVNGCELFITENNYNLRCFQLFQDEFYSFKVRMNSSLIMQTLVGGY